MFSFCRSTPLSVSRYKTVIYLVFAFRRLGHNLGLMHVHNISAHYLIFNHYILSLSLSLSLLPFLQNDEGYAVNVLFDDIYGNNTKRKVMVIGGLRNEITEAISKPLIYWGVVQVSSYSNYHGNHL